MRSVLLAPLAIFAQLQALFIDLFILLRKIINSLANAAFKLNQFFFILCRHIIAKLIIILWSRLSGLNPVE